MSDEPTDGTPTSDTDGDDAEHHPERDETDSGEHPSNPPDDSEADPFERLDADAPDRKGDPFERLDSSAVSSESARSGESDSRFDDSDAHDSRSESSASESFEPDPGTLEPEQRSRPSSQTDVAADDSDPDADSDRDQSEMRFEGTELNTDSFDRTDREGDPFASLEGAFEDTSTDKIDPDVVWETLERAESVGDSPQRTYAEVSKHSYCEQCEYFSDPPEINCAHEGTEIVEFPDSETVRVVDCPIVAERRELEADE